MTLPGPPVTGPIQGKFPDGLIFTNVDMVLNWARKSSLWPMTFGLACCAGLDVVPCTGFFAYALAREYKYGRESFRRWSPVSPPSNNPCQQRHL